MALVGTEEKKWYTLNVDIKSEIGSLLFEKFQDRKNQNFFYPYPLKME